MMFTYWGQFGAPDPLSRACKRQRKTGFAAEGGTRSRHFLREGLAWLQRADPTKNTRNDAFRRGRDANRSRTVI